MMKFVKRSLAAALLAGTAGYAAAADMPEPPVVEAPPAVEYQSEPSFGGWYIRGDADYHWNDFRGAKYYTYNYDPDTETIYGSHDGRLNGDLDESWSVGAGVGYKITDHLRTDLTVDYFGDADFEGKTRGFCGGEPCESRDRTTLSTWLLLANAYADLGTYHGFTPYIGAGIGGAHVKWDNLRNTIGEETWEHDGGKEWRFAYAFMAGTSYCLSRNLDLDIGYRYSRVEGGRMFDFAFGAGPGDDDGFNVHEVRGGLRYNFGGRSGDGCGAPEPVAYEPAPVEPVYK